MGGPGGAMMAGLGPAPAPGTRPTRRNPMMLLLVIVGLAFLPQILATVGGMIGVYFLGYIGYLANIAYYVYFSLNAFKMAQELKAFTNDQVLNPVFMWIPCFSLYVAGFQILPLVQRAKQQVGSQAPTKHIALYIFPLTTLWAFASDLNDVAA
jgi:hypothetical protein